MGATQATPAPAPPPLRVALVARPGGAGTGVGRYVQMLERGLGELGVATRRVAPAAPPLPAAAHAALRRARLDLRSFLMTYPLWAAYPPAEVYHLASQNLATLLLLRRPPGRVVVTVHDIIPYLLRHDRELSAYRGPGERLFDRLAMAGLRRADRLVADSQYTRRTLLEQLGVAPERVSVVYLGVDGERFRPLPAGAELRARYRLPPGPRYLIYVGSEDPRKNLVTLVQALALVRRGGDDVQLIKVGRAHFDGERRRLRELAAALGVAGAIRWLDEVPEADLPGLYSLAELCVLPSRYEGFGLPALEALACGTPLVCADAASLPELAGPASALVDPLDPAAFAAAILAALGRPRPPAGQLRAHAARFSWQRTAIETREVYG